jgi:hypothetical protein
MRWGCLAWLAMWVYLIVAGWAQHVVPAWFPIYWAHLTLALLGIASVHWVVFRVRNWWLFRYRLHGLHMALNDLVGWPEHTKPYHWLHVPVGYDKRMGATIRIDLKHKSAREEKPRELILTTAASKLGTAIDPADASWKLDQRRPYVEVRLSWPPPPRALFLDNLDRIEKQRKQSVVAVGIGKFDKTMTFDFDTDAPHMMVVATTGRGKSQTLGDIGCQPLHKGAFGVVLDVKRTSLPCFKELPNVAYYAGEEECHYALLAWEREMKRRQQIIDIPRGQKRPDIGPRGFLLAEESDGMVEQLRMWWQIREGTRSNVPSLSVMNTTRLMGRTAKLHQIVVTQTGDARAVGGGGARSQFGVQVISADVATWKKVVPQCKTPPAGPSVHKGRWHFFRNGLPDEVQVFGFVDPPPGHEDEEMDAARLYATSGVVAEVPELLRRENVLPPELLGQPAVTLSSPNGAAFGAGPQAGVMGSVHKVVAHVVDHAPHSATSVPHLRLVETRGPRSLTEEIAGGGYTVAPVEADRLLSLDEAVEAGYFPSIVAARSASKRPGFPASEMTRPAGTARGGRPAKLYRESELAALRHAGVS